MKFFSKLNNQNGQALLIVVLIMVVALTVTLSLVSRSVVNLKTAVDQTSSQKALSAAEAGVEQAIRNNVSVGTSTIGGAQYKADIVPVAYKAGGILVNGGNLVSKDEGAYVWLSPYVAPPGSLWGSPWPSSNAGTTADLYIYWGDNSGDANNAAIEAVLISGTSAVPKTTRYAFDPYQSRANDNNFDYTDVTQGTYPVDAETFSYRAKITVSQGLLLRIIPLYFSTGMAVRRVSSSDPLLPDQGQMITSSGCNPNCTSAGSVQRKVTVFQGYPIMPAELFPYSLFSP